MILGNNNGNQFNGFSKDNTFASHNFTITLPEENKNDTYLDSLDKSLEILKDRYVKKQITLEEFKKQADEIGKKKEAYLKKKN